jgi:oxygen-independent coproporphyrinogen-3 oxidase
LTLATSPGAPPIGVYVHWPYCRRICPYCDFNVTRERGQGAEQAALVDAILDDLHAQASLTGPRSLVSIFFGGGTPSLMRPEALARIIEAARSLWAPAADLEITLEANPTDAETDAFATFADVGVNRLSLGLQSLDDEALRFLGRNHDAATGRRAAARAAAVFPRVSLDLIYALPGQTPQAWRRSLLEGVGLGPEHISPYQLTIEAGTAFDRAARRGAMVPPGPDVGADLFETTQTVLRDAGYEAYEVSNHARGEAARSRHNLVYWRGEDYLGVGPGAHGRLTLSTGRAATTTPRAVKDYINRVRTKGSAAQVEPLNTRDIALERLLMGLRTVEGVDLGVLATLEIPSARLMDAGDLLHVSGDRLTVTRRGRPVLDAIIAMLAHGA